MATQGRGWLACLGAGLMCLALAGQAEASKLRYEITDLGTLPGYDTPIVRGLNNRGQVVGMVSPRDGSGLRSFLYSDGRMQELPDGPLVSDINDAGQLARGGGRAVDGPSINNRGQIATWEPFRLADGSWGNRTVIAEGDQVTPLPFNSWSDSSIPTGINDLGQIVGNYATIPGDVGSYELRSFFYDGSRIVDLGLMADGVALAINNAGQIVLGNATQAFLYQDGTKTDLGTLGGELSSAFDINTMGQIVGESTTSDRPWSSVRAFLYADGAMLGLNDLIPFDSGWVLESATAINDLGQIAGTGVFEGEQRAFLLTPTTVPEPTALALFVATVALAGGHRVARLARPVVMRRVRSLATHSDENH